MGKSYDNWERLVKAVLLREHFRELSLISSSSSSPSSTSSFHSTSQFVDQSPVEGHEGSELPAEDSNITIDHSEWTTMLPPYKPKVELNSASMRFFLDKTTGKNCFMIGVRKILIYCSEFMYHSASRFEKVAKLESKMATFIRGRIKTQMLSPKTSYAAYLVFGLLSQMRKDDESAAAATIATIRVVVDVQRGSMWLLRPILDRQKAYTVHLQPIRDDDKTYALMAVRRDDGWMELALADFYVHQGGNSIVEFLLQLTPWTGDFVIDGIEFRPWN